MGSQKCRTNNGSRFTIKVGATGTIGSLMSQELESMKERSQASSTQKKPQSPPVSVPCGSTPRKSQLRRNSTDDSSSSSTSSGNSDTGLNKIPTNPWKNAHRVPMLGADVNADRMNNKDQKKPNSSYIVEVVDLKCSNPMSSRLKKLGFSKLSESTA